MPKKIMTADTGFVVCLLERPMLGIQILDQKSQLDLLVYSFHQLLKSIPAFIAFPLR